MDLTGKAALVTGGTMGIGKAIAIDLARGGADVAIVARHLGEAAEQVQAEIENLERKLLTPRRLSQLTLAARQKPARNLRPPFAQSKSTTYTTVHSSIHNILYPTPFRGGCENPIRSRKSVSTTSSACASINHNI